MITRMLIGCLAGITGAVLMYLPAVLVFSVLTNTGSFEVVICALFVAYPLGATIGILISQKFLLRIRSREYVAIVSSLVGGVTSGSLVVYILLQVGGAILVIAPVFSGIMSSLFFHLAVIIRPRLKGKKRV